MSSSGRSFRYAMIIIVLLCAFLRSKAQNALNLGGSRTCVTSTHPAFRLSQFSIECWFRMDNGGTFTSTGHFKAIPLVTKGRNEAEAGTADINYFLGIREKSFLLCADYENTTGGSNPGGNNPITGTTRIFADVWYHAAVTLSNNTFSLYLNGNLEAQRSISTAPQTGGVQPFCIGSAMNSSGTSAGSFKGTISEVRIWNTALTESALRSNLFTRGISSPNLVARYPFNQNTGITIADSSGNNRSGTVQGSLFSWQQASPFTDPLTLTREPYIQQSSPTAVTIAWRTNIPSTSLIRYSLNWQVLPELVSDLTYATDHFITISHLLPGRKYYYSVGSDSRLLQRDTNNQFTLPPLPGSKATTLAWITGDAGTGQAGQDRVYQAFLNRMNGQTPDVWINCGNQAYSSGSDANYQQNFYNVYAATLKKTSFWPLPGEKDYATDSVRQDDHFIPYNHLFRLSQTGTSGVPSGKKEYYSFDHGDVHFICLDAYGEQNNKRLSDTTSTQAVWLKNDLAASPSTWKVVCLAFPPHTMGTLNSDTDNTLIRIRENITPILERYNVDLVISGGSIVYERSYLLNGFTGKTSDYKTWKHRVSSSRAGYNGTANSCPYIKNKSNQKKGTVYAVVGSSGKIGSAQPGYPHPAMAFSNVNKAGSLLLRVRGNRLDAEWLRDDGVIADRFTFLKNTNDTTIIQVNSGQAIELKAPWEGTYSWSGTGSALQTINTAVTSTSFITVRDSLNCFASTWKLVVAGQKPNNPTLVAPASQSCCNGSSPALITNVSDPNGGPLSVKWYGRKKPDQPAPPAPFSIIGVPDTQFYTAEERGGTNASFKSQMNWITGIRQAYNVAFVAHYGDCTEHGDNGGNPIEWQRADTAFKIIENPGTTQLTHGIPYGICVGNHDQSPNGNPNGSSTFYNQYFGSSRFSARPYYGGYYGSNYDNHYELFSASGYNFIIISLEYDESGGAAVLAWADALLKQYPSRRGIIYSHYLLEPNGNFGVQGQATYNALKNNPNLFLMLCGHRSGEANRSDTFNGNTVHTILADYQTRLNGGTGWLQWLEFVPAENLLKVKTFSPVLNLWEDDQNSSFSLPVDLYPQFQLLGNVSNISSGSNTSFTWNNLSPGSYEWYVSVSDGISEVSGPVWTFTVGTGPRLQEPEPVRSLRVIPNPARNSIRIESREPLAEKTAITDMQGRFIRYAEADGETDISLLQPGMYVLQVRYADGSSGTAVFVKE